MKYRKKPIEIEAIQWTGSNVSDMCKFMKVDVSHLLYSGYLMIATLEGVMRADKGDYIIKGVHGEFYPCKPGIFEETYEEAHNENS